MNAHCCGVSPEHLCELARRVRQAGRFATVWSVHRALHALGTRSMGVSSVLMLPMDAQVGAVWAELGGRRHG